MSEFRESDLAGSCRADFQKRRNCPGKELQRSALEASQVCAEYYDVHARGETPQAAEQLHQHSSQGSPGAGNHWGPLAIAVCA